MTFARAISAHCIKCGKKQQKAIFYQVAGKDFTDYFSFKWNDKTEKWEVIDGAKFENYIKLLVSDNN